MKQKLFTDLILPYLFLLGVPFSLLKGQANCVLQPPILHIDFGNNTRSVKQNLPWVKNLQIVYDNCPNDGFYAIVSSTSGCFNGNWITVNGDHTPNDIDGKMLLVNAAYEPGLFFVMTLPALNPNTTYELAAWLLNICRTGYNCIPIRPDLVFIVENTVGKELARFSTGALTPAGTASWMEYSALFKTPAEATTLLLKIENKADGGCGNDFAMDDITVRECAVPKPVVKPVKAKPKAVILPTTPDTKQVFKKISPVLIAVKKDIPAITKIPVKGSPVILSQAIKERPAILLPAPISSRTNPIIKQIETVASEIKIDLYDNGEIDGDTVSVYHNNVLIVSRAGLSAKPITFRIAVDAMHPHHELVMVANNLGSIPPNTSLMIVTAGNKRYEVFISSTEQQNAKVVIDLGK